MNAEGILRGCLVESDPAVAARGRRQRRRALLIAIVLQVLLLTLLILAPLLGAVDKLGWSVRLLEPVPPYRPVRGGEQKLQAQREHLNPDKPSPGCRLCAPVRIPPTVDMRPDLKPPDIADEPESGSGTIGIPGVGIDVFDPRNRRPAVPDVPAPAAPKEWQTKMIRVSAPIQEARLIHRVEPEYPVLALQSRLEGRVELRAIIARDGTIRSLQVLSGNILFVRATIEAIQQWRYQPTLQGGEPVEVETMITVIFTLRR
jgi:protein TonB